MFKTGTIAMIVMMAMANIAVAAEKPRAQYVDPDSPDAIALADQATSMTVEPWMMRDRFGLMIHWSPVAIPFNTWKELGIELNTNEQSPELQGDPSWYFRRYEIPLMKWRGLATRFNPTGFNADEWVRMVKDAGMRYITITSKHHEGFAMFDTAASTYDVVDATPWKRDPMKELAAACRRHGIRLCFYYSQAQDWEHPDGAGNDWDYDQKTKDFSRYFEEKCLPQVRELMTNYGPVGLFWCDTPVTITPQQSMRLFNEIKAAQPECLINSRIGNGVGDYMSMGDSQFPDAQIAGLWETACTSHIHWFYGDNDVKPRMDAGMIIRYLIHNVSRGGNLAMNFGPDYRGMFSEDSKQLLKNVGAWMRENGAAIHECGRNPFLTDFDWGTITTRPGFLYLHVTDWPGENLTLYGLQNEVQGVRLLASGKALAHESGKFGKESMTALSIDLAGVEPDPIATVIEVKIAGSAQVRPCVIPQMNGSIRLEMMVLPLSTPRSGRTIPAPYATVAGAPAKRGAELTAWGAGYLERWTNPAQTFSYQLMPLKAGQYKAYAVIAKSRTKGADKENLFDGSVAIELRTGGQTVSSPLQAIAGRSPVRTGDPTDTVVEMGGFELQEGLQTLDVGLSACPSQYKIGPTLRTVVLVPQRDVEP